MGDIAAEDDAAEGKVVEAKRSMKFVSFADCEIESLPTLASFVDMTPQTADATEFAAASRSSLASQMVPCPAPLSKADTTEFAVASSSSFDSQSQTVLSPSKAETEGGCRRPAAAAL